MSKPSQGLYHLRPKLEDVLDDVAPYPYTLAAFIAFLDQSHCLETVEFLLETKRYSRTYDWLKARGKAREDPILESHLLGFWNRMIDQYIQPNAVCQVNIPDEIRHELVEYSHSHKDHPPPSVLDAAVTHVKDLLKESLLIPFMNSCSATSHVQSLYVPTVGGEHQIPSTGRAADDPTVRKRWRLGQFLSDLTGSLDVLTGTGPRIGPTSPLIEIRQGDSIREPSSLSAKTEAQDYAIQRRGIVHSKTIPQREPGGWRKIFKTGSEKNLQRFLDR